MAIMYPSQYMYHALLQKTDGSIEPTPSTMMPSPVLLPVMPSPMMPSPVTPSPMMPLPVMPLSVMPSPVTTNPPSYLLSSFCPFTARSWARHIHDCSRDAAAVKAPSSFSPRFPDPDSDITRDFHSHARRAQHDITQDCHSHARRAQHRGSRLKAPFLVALPLLYNSAALRGPPKRKPQQTRLNEVMGQEKASLV